MSRKQTDRLLAFILIAFAGFLFGGCYTRSELDGKAEEAFQVGKSVGYEEGYNAGFRDCGRVEELNDALPMIN